MTTEFWYLIGAALVFFMQAGFAMVETGFTRAKNAGNIIMKNLMDFCIGTVVFMLLGYGLMMGEDALAGLVGIPNLDLFGKFTEFIASPEEGLTEASKFVFNLVFCATAATIVSGSMAERTKFSAYCIYSAIISLVVYPIEAHWIWGGGWLAQMGFYDYAGSTAIHMVGGLTALIGAIMVGPRIGKYERDEKGKVIKVNAIMGHSIPLGALGAFILWFGWYGFNGAAATSVSELATIFLNTTIAPAVATCTTLIFTWIKNKKPDVSMCINACLAGLVGVTAGCATLDAIGATVVGLVSGFLVVLVIEFIDLKLHIDDPVGAVGVHLANGIWGTIAVGLLANPNAPAGLKGLFYTGDWYQLGIQTLGIVTVCAYTALLMTLFFFIIKKTAGLRVKPEEETKGLDVSEHGLINAYADFAPNVASYALAYEGAEGLKGEFDVEGRIVLDEDTSISVSSEKKSGVEKAAAVDDKEHKFTKVQIICKEERLQKLNAALTEIGITGMTVSHVMGYGQQKGKKEYYRGVPVTVNLLPKVQVDIVVSKVPVSAVIDAAKAALYTGEIGDGKIFVYDVENVVKVRTGEEGYDALQDSK